MSSSSHSPSSNHKPSCVVAFQRQRRLLKSVLTNFMGNFAVLLNTQFIRSSRYLNVTAMYIDTDNWLHYKLLAFVHIRTGEGVQVIASTVEKVLTQYGIANNTFCIIDLSPDNDIGDYIIHHRVVNLRRESRPFQSFCVFSAMHTLISTGDQLISPYMTKVIAAKQICRDNEAAFCRLCPDVQREFFDFGAWASTFPDVAQSAEELQCTLMYQPQIVYFLNAICSDDQPSCLDWFMCNRWSNLLNGLVPYVRILSLTEHFPTSHLVVEQLNEMVKKFEMANSDNTEFSLVLARINHKFSSLFAGLPKVFCLASIFNPIYKMTGTFLMMETIAAITGLQFQITREEILASLLDLFNSYANRYYTDFDIIEYNDYEMDDGPSTMMFVDGPLEWWQANSNRYPVLSQIARDILTVPGSTHELSNEIHDITWNHIKRRHRDLSEGGESERVQAHVCLQQWSGDDTQESRRNAVRNCDCLFQM